MPSGVATGAGAPVFVVVQPTNTTASPTLASALVPRTSGSVARTQHVSMREALDHACLRIQAESPESVAIAKAVVDLCSAEATHDRAPPYNGN